MSKKEKYLKNLSVALKDFEYKNEIVSKYDALITEKLNNKEKITEILKKIGNIDFIANKEIENYQNKKKYKTILKNISNITTKAINSIKKSIKSITNKRKKAKFKNKIRLKRIKNKVNTKKLKKIILAKQTKIKYSWLILIFQIFLFIFLFYSLTLFMASLFAILDGIKLYGLSLFLLSLSSLIFLVLSLLNKKRIGVKVNDKFYFISFVVTIVMLSLSVGYTMYNYFDIQHISDISEKYSFGTENLEYMMPKNDKDLHIYFNSWYKTSYLIITDNKLKDKIKVELKYYEAFYDLYDKREYGNIYISLAFDTRDLISMYLDNLKENKIYNEKEFSRYLIRIYVSEENAERLIIHN